MELTALTVVAWGGFIGGFNNQVPTPNELQHQKSRCQMPDANIFFAELATIDWPKCIALACEGFDDWHHIHIALMLTGKMPWTSMVQPFLE